MTSELKNNMDEGLKGRGASDRFAQVDSLRAFAVGIVMIHHFCSGKFFLSGFGVTLFFTLSAFFATNTLLRLKEKVEAGSSTRLGALKTFYTRRWLRIWPLYYLVLILTFLFNVEYARETFLWNATFLSNIPLLASGEWAGRFSHLWSLAVLEQFYLLWPALILWTPRRWLLLLAAGLSLLGVLYNILCAGMDLSPFYWFATPAAAFDSLGVGALLSVCLAKTSGEAASQRIEWWAGKIFMPFFCLLLVGKIFDYVPPGYAIYIGVTASLAFIHLTRRAMEGYSGIVGRILENRLLVHIGRMSYSIFLLHEFTGLLLPRTGFLHDFAESEYRIVLLLPLTILLAHLAWKFVESPVIEFRKKLLRAPDYARAAKPAVAAIQGAVPTSSTAFSVLRFESAQRETSQPAAASAS